MADTATAPLWLGAELVRSLANRGRRHAHVGLSSTVAAASRQYKFRRLAKGHQSERKISIGFQFATQPRMIRHSLTIPLMLTSPISTVAARAMSTQVVNTAN